MAFNTTTVVPGMNPLGGGSFGTGEMATRMTDFADQRRKDRLMALGLAKTKSEEVKKRYINDRVRNVLSMEPKPAMAVEGDSVFDPKYKPATEAETPDAYSMRVKQGLGEIADLDPMVALGLASKMTDPYREQSNADRLFGLEQTKQNNLQDYRKDTLKQQDKNSERSYDKGRYKTFTDDYGKSWKYNSNTGKMEEINTGSYGSDNKNGGGITSKNVVMVDKTVPDGFGGHTTIKVPVNKVTGKDAQGNIPTVTKQAVLSQKDKDFTKNYGSGSKTISNVRNTLDNTGIWGGLDAITGPIGNFFNTQEGKQQSLAKQDLENLRLEATNKLTGVLSDQDMKIILDTIPTIDDQPDVARVKLAKVESAIADADANQFNRLVKSNPAAVKDMAIGMVNGSVSVPAGYQLVQYDDGAVALIKK